MYFFSRSLYDGRFISTPHTSSTLQKHADLNFNVSTQAPEANADVRTPQTTGEHPTHPGSTAPCQLRPEARTGMPSTQKSRPRCVRRVCCGASAPFACAPRAPEPLGSAGAYPALQRGCSGCGDACLNLTCIRSAAAVQGSVRQHCAQPVRPEALPPRRVVVVPSLTWAR